jgi:hypothetical protein
VARKTKPRKVLNKVSAYWDRVRMARALEVGGGRAAFYVCNSTGELTQNKHHAGVRQRHPDQGQFNACAAVTVRGVVCCGEVCFA